MNERKTNGETNLIAPCGLNCRVCRAHLRDRKPCPGCRGENTFKSRSCTQCKLKNCAKRIEGGWEYCFQCDEFPCARLFDLDERYRTNYGTSPIENLSSLQKIGIQRFSRNDRKRWTCPQCGGLLCMHQAECPACGYLWNKSKIAPRARRA